MHGANNCHNFARTKGAPALGEHLIASLHIRGSLLATSIYSLIAYGVDIRLTAYEITGDRLY